MESNKYSCTPQVNKGIHWLQRQNKCPWKFKTFFRTTSQESACQKLGTPYLMIINIYQTFIRWGKRWVDTLSLYIQRNKFISKGLAIHVTWNNFIYQSENRGKCTTVLLVCYMPLHIISFGIVYVHFPMLLVL